MYHDMLVVLAGFGLAHLSQMAYYFGRHWWNKFRAA